MSVRLSAHNHNVKDTSYTVKSIYTHTHIYYAVFEGKAEQRIWKEHTASWCCGVWLCGNWTTSEYECLLWSGPVLELRGVFVQNERAARAQCLSWLLYVVYMGARNYSLGISEKGRMGAT